MPAKVIEFPSPATEWELALEGVGKKHLELLLLFCDRFRREDIPPFDAESIRQLRHALLALIDATEIGLARGYWAEPGRSRGYNPRALHAELKRVFVGLIEG